MSLTFNNVCELLQNVENVSKKRPALPPKELKECVDECVHTWFTKYRVAVDNSNGGAFLSMVFPLRRKDRVYGLQVPSLAKKLSKLLNFNHGQQMLFNGWIKGSQGDLGVYLELAMRPWTGTLRKKQYITIETVDRLLVQLAAKNRFSDPALRRMRDWDVKTDAELKGILIRLDVWEAKWLVWLILRNYPSIDMNENFVFRKYHFLLPDLLLFQNDFDAVFNMLKGEMASYPAVPTPRQEQRLRIDASEKLRAVVGIKVGRPTFYKAWSFKHLFQMTEQKAWAAEVKYDGEYCEIHVDLEKAQEKIRIFSKNGKDATAGRRSVHDCIRTALKIGQSNCNFRKNCIVLGELVLYSDRENKILPFSKIRKHISRSGTLTFL